MQKNHISTQECTQLKPKSLKQFEVKAPKGHKGRVVYEIEYNARGISKKVIPILDMFITRKNQKPIDIILINQSKDTVWIPQGKHLRTIHLVEGRRPSEEEVQEIIH